jgi:NAD(P)-dependent dehydrogenase (short-subunit alcohol dehydrogenase family)
MYTLVTGATSDIGRTICEVLAFAGHKVLLSDLSEEALQEVLKQMPHRELHRVLPIDLSDYDGAKDTLESFVKENDIRIASAVFAAGIFSVKPLRMIDYAFVKKCFDVSLFSIISLMQVLTSKKLNAGALKSVVIVSSVSAKMGTKGYSVYGSVKAGLLGLMRSLAVELGPTVRTNAILPGGIRTKTTSFIYDNMEGADPRYILGEGKPSDIANVIKFLLSDDAKWITGQEIVVDGGLSAN